VAAMKMIVAFMSGEVWLLSIAICVPPDVWFEAARADR